MLGTPALNGCISTYVVRTLLDISFYCHIGLKELVLIITISMSMLNINFDKYEAIDSLSHIVSNCLGKILS